jgi:hypothetical protein
MGLDATDIAFLNTITFFAAAMGRLLSGYLADRMGRRFMLNVNLALFTLGAVGCALAPDYAFLAVARAIVGFGLGGEITTAVTMLAEFCSARFRGTAVGLINVGGGGLGNMLAPAFALGVFTLFPGDDSWRWLFGCLVMPAIFIVFYRRFVPETPRFLLSKGRVEEANQVLSMLAAGKRPMRSTSCASSSARAAPRRRRLPRRPCSAALQRHLQGRLCAAHDCRGCGFVDDVWCAALGAHADADDSGRPGLLHHQELQLHHRHADGQSGRRDRGIDHGLLLPAQAGADGRRDCRLSGGAGVRQLHR